MLFILQNGKHDRHAHGQRFSLQATLDVTGKYSFDTPHAKLQRITAQTLVTFRPMAASASKASLVAFTENALQYAEGDPEVRKIGLSSLLCHKPDEVSRVGLV